METNLIFSYGDPAGRDHITCPVTLGFGPEESNHLDDATFAELRLDGTLEAWFEPMNQLAMWLILSSRGLQAEGPEPGVIRVERVGPPGPGVVLTVHARLRQRADFMALSTALLEHLTFEGGRYL